MAEELRTGTELNPVGNSVADRHGEPRCIALSLHCLSLYAGASQESSCSYRRLDF